MPFVCPSFLSLHASHTGREGAPHRIHAFCRLPSARTSMALAFGRAGPRHVRRRQRMAERERKLKTNDIFAQSALWVVVDLAIHTGHVAWSEGAGTATRWAPGAAGEEERHNAGRFSELC